MPRKKLEHSSTGIYHVVQEGLAHIDLFKDEEDVEFYLSLVMGMHQEGKWQLFAYAVHPHYLHLLFREGETPATDIRKSIATSYSYYYNVKYNHTGPILDRSLSQPVETRDLFIRVLDHIHWGSPQGRIENGRPRVSEGRVVLALAMLSRERGRPKVKAASKRETCQARLNMSEGRELARAERRLASAMQSGSVLDEVNRERARGEASKWKIENAELQSEEKASLSSIWKQIKSLPTEEELYGKGESLSPRCILKQVKSLPKARQEVIGPRRLERSMTAEEIMAYMKKKYGCSNAEEFQALDARTRYAAILDARSKGCGLRLLEELTGERSDER